MFRNGAKQNEGYKPNVPELGHSRQVDTKNKILNIFLNAFNNCREGSTSTSDRSKDKIKLQRTVFSRNGAK